MNYLLRIIFLLLMVVLFGCEKDDQVPTNNIIFDDSEFGIDVINKIIVYNGNSIAIENGELNIGDNILEIDTDDDILSIGKAYTVTYSEEIFQLFYTQLPIISVKTNGNEIIDDPKVAGSLRILEKNKEAYNSFIGIELRGGVSQEYPKKSYSMELWADEAGDSKEDESLLGMRVDDDWILDGMWNEPNRIRDYTSHDLWLQMGRVQNPREETKLGIDRKYCELFENGNYKGVYCLSEKIDRKQLDLKKYDKQLEGELYKGYTWGDGVTFAGVTDFDNIDLTWSGYEAKYPDDVGFLDWSNLFNHVDFITSSSQSDFNSEISFRIDMKNAIDYFIFINFIYASDNTGKNIYTAKFKKSSPYFFVPWDLDGSFGTIWTGERIDKTDGLLSNGLFDKLLNFPDFKNGVKERWQELRLTVLEIGNVNQLFFDNENYLATNAIYEREALVPEITQNYSDLEVEYIESWIERRTTFLDEYFNGL